MIKVGDKIEVSYQRHNNVAVVVGEFSDLGKDWLEVNNPKGHVLGQCGLFDGGCPQVLIPVSRILEIEVLTDT